jgi:hypothetical protein
MKLCRIIAFYLMCACVWAASGSTVEQIKQFIQSAIKLKSPDKEVAETLRTMKLSERLDLDAVEALQTQGAGPRTVAVLKELATASASLPPPAPPAAKPVYVPPPAPSSEEQAKLLDEVKDYAINYTHRLPDFICLEQTRRYVDTTGKEAWRLADTLTARLSYFDQKEDYKLVSQNDKVSTGMRDIFDPASHASFAWERWGKLRGRVAHVFTYRIPLEFSRYSIEYQGEKKDEIQRIVAAYHGSVFVDKEYNTIVRITQEADDIPPNFPVREVKETLDYDFTKIGENEFFLPLLATVRMHTGREWTKNEKEFRLYRKFSADAVIKFDEEQSTPPK